MDFDILTCSLNISSPMKRMNHQMSHIRSQESWTLVEVDRNVVTSGRAKAMRLAEIEPAPLLHEVVMRGAGNGKHGTVTVSQPGTTWNMIQQSWFKWLRFTPLRFLISGGLKC